MISQYMSKKA